LEGRGENGFEKREETSGKNREVWEGMSLDGYFFFITQNPPIWGNSKIVLDGGFEGVWRVYMNFSNLINVVIMFLNS
jgi:hypothetical protein